MSGNVCDVMVIGGGFYGCCLALYLRGHGYSVVLLEKEAGIMGRASAVNQARVHTGFHYPRSLTTAIRSLMNFPRFVYEFRKAVVDDFTMLYAVAREGSKVNARRFWRMYKELDAPIKPADKSRKSLFNPALIEDVFAVREYAFDHDVLRTILQERLEVTGVDLRMETEAFSCRKEGDGTCVETSVGTVKAGHVFNCTYSRINRFLEASGIPIVALKHEITEMALVNPPELLRGLAVTVMDGPFFSIMPYPSLRSCTLSHVRYTPHCNWRDASPCPDGHAVLDAYRKTSRFPYMYRDVRRFMPELELTRTGSLFEVKTVLIRNESDDGRPIFCRKHPELGEVYTVMGSKIDNVYDLFEGLRGIATPLSRQTSLWRTALGIS